MRNLFSLILLSGIVLPSLLASDTEIIGSIGKQDISLEEVRSALAHLDPNQAEAVRNDPKVLEQVVRAFLAQKLVLKKALEKKWDQEPAIVAKLARARDSAITESYLESVAQPPADYPGEDDLRSAYEASKEALRIPRSFRLAQIFVTSEQKLAAVGKRLKAKDTDFVQVAQTESEDTASAARGGEIGWLTEAQIQPELRSRINTLTLNEISEPIRLGDGWHILKLLDAREPYTPTFEQVRVQLTRQLRTEKLRANTQAHLARLLKENPLSLNTSVLAKALPEAR